MPADRSHRESNQPAPTSEAGPSSSSPLPDSTSPPPQPGSPLPPYTARPSQSSQPAGTSHRSTPTSSLLPPAHLSQSVFSNELGPVYSRTPSTTDTQGSSQSSFGRTRRTPEKCLTFCSQRDDAPPLCRMFCLRKRQVMPTQAEALARLRPPRPSTLSNHDKVREPERELVSQPWWSGWNPFEALRRRVEPYSLIYIKGEIDGAIGRYMEEMSENDGHHDFGWASRGSSDKSKKVLENKAEWIDWQESGSLLYLPMTSIFSPIIAIPKTVNSILNPSRKFLAMYYDSFFDGTQWRGLSKFKAEIEGGGARKMLAKVRDYQVKRVERRKEEIEALKNGNNSDKGVEGKD